MVDRLLFVCKLLIPILIILQVVGCKVPYSVTDESTAMEIGVSAVQDSSNLQVVIVFYDTQIGPKPLLRAINKEKCEIVYTYSNFNAYALKIRGQKTKDVLIHTRGVIAVMDDQVLELDE